MIDWATNHLNHNFQVFFVNMLNSFISCDIASLLELYTTSVDVYYSSGWVLDEFNVEASCSFQHTTCDKV